MAEGKIEIPPPIGLLERRGGRLGERRGEALGGRRRHRSGCKLLLEPLRALVGGLRAPF